MSRDGPMIREDYAARTRRGSRARESGGPRGLGHSAGNKLRSDRHRAAATCLTCTSEVEIENTRKVRFSLCLEFIDSVVTPYAHLAPADPLAVIRTLRIRVLITRANTGEPRSAQKEEIGDRRGLMRADYSSG